MPVDAGSAVGYLDLDISGFLANLRTAQSEADGASKNIATKIGNNLMSAGKSITSAGKFLTAGVTTQIVGLGAAAIKTTADFESAMSKVSAISGATGSDLDALNLKAQEMGAKTKFSATESAEAFTYMAMAGWKTEDMLQGIDGIMALAAADGLDLATTSDIVTDALTAFGLSAGDSGHFADVLAKAASNANTNVTLLGESFKYAAPVAGALGYSAEDTAIALGLMANAGIKGSQGGTALRSSLSRLVKPTDDVAEAMDLYHISLVNTDGTMKSLGEVMGILRSSLGNLTEAEQAQAAATLFGQEAMSGMLAIINASEADYEKLTSAIYDAEGAANEMSETMLNNFSGQLTLLKSALEGLAIQFGTILLPYVKNFVSWLQELVTKFQNLSEEQKNQIVKWGAFAAAIGPVLIIVGKLVTAVGSIVTAFGKIPGAITKVKGAFTVLKTAMAGISAPILAIVAVIVTLAAAFDSLWKNNEEFRNKMTAIWGQIKETFDGFCNGLVERINALGFDFENITQVLSAIWQGFCDLLAPVFEGAFSTIANALSTVLDVILGIVDAFIALFKGDWEGCWNAVSGVFETAWEGIVNAFQIVCDILKGILDVACGWFDTTWSETWESIKTFFTNTLESIKTALTEALNAIKTAITNTFNAIKTFTTETWNSIKTTISTSIDNTKTKVETTVNSIKSTISSGFTSAKNTVTNIFDNIKSKISSVMSSAKSTVQSAIDAIKSKFNFSWSLPKLKMPHISISGSFSLNPPSVPRFSIQWYKSAMQNGMILDEPTIFGYNARTGTFLAGGEAGSETVVGTKNLMSMIKASVAEAVDEAFKKIEEAFANLHNNLGVVSDKLIIVLTDLLAVSNKYSRAIGSFEGSIPAGDNKEKFDYELLAKYLSDEFRNAPVEHNVSVEMKDGDVYMDKERVGRKLAPVVSRVQAQGLS